MSAGDRNARIAARFGAAAGHYARHAGVQRDAAEELAARIARLPLPERPRILEIGCGTGFLGAALARRLGPARWTLTDIAPPMLEQARKELALPGDAEFRVMDGEYPDLPEGGFDLVCSSLAVQWFGDLNAGLARLARLLAPGGHLAIATLAQDTFAEWRAAHAAHGLEAAVPRYPPASVIGAGLAGMRGQVETRVDVRACRDGLDFLRGLKAIGAATPAPGSKPLPPRAFKRVLDAFNRQGASVSYHLAYGMWKKETGPRGVFVTGTDTGIGKTLVSALLVKAWQADYWKPLQTGVASEPADTDTVAALAEVPPARLHPPHAVLQAPLSPWDAAREEGVALDASRIAAPKTDAPLVVEGAGGLLVPIDERHAMIDLAASLGLPVVLVARSTLGTINHTLLSLQALRHRGLPVLGVVMSGEPSPRNRRAIERFGQVRVLAEIPLLDRVDAAAVAEWAGRIPALEELGLA